MRVREFVSYRLGMVMLCAFMAGCTDPGNTVSKAEQLADNFYVAVKNQDFDKAASYFEDTPNDPRGRWLKELRDNHDKLGNLESYKMVDKEVDTVYSGTRYIFIYQTTYTKYPARETLILFDGVSTFGGGDDKHGMGIQGMVVKSKGL